MTEEMPDQVGHDEVVGHDDIGKVGHDDIGKVGHDEVRLNDVGVSDEGLPQVLPRGVQGVHQVLFPSALEVL